jgi:hypothetical protein
MQIHSASLLAAQQARSPAAPQRTPAKAQAEDLFEPLFGKPETKAAAPQTQDASPASFARPGSQIDIRV